MKRNALRVVLATIATLVVGSLAIRTQAQTTISDTRGTVILRADDASIAGPRQNTNQAPRHIPCWDFIASGRSESEGSVHSWNHLSLYAHARIGAPVRKPQLNNPYAIADATAGSWYHVGRFHHRPTGHPVNMKVELGFWATLESGVAQVTVKASLVPIARGAAPVATLTKTYHLEVDSTDPTGKTIKITGDQTKTMVNGGHISFTELAGSGIAPEGYSRIEFSVTIANVADTKADVYVNEAHLSL